MNTSRGYLKTLSIIERKSLAEKLSVRSEYLYQISAGIRTPSRKLAIRLENLTDGRVRANDFEEELRTVINTN